MVDEDTLRRRYTLSPVLRTTFMDDVAETTSSNLASILIGVVVEYEPFVVVEVIVTRLAFSVSR
jgi:hypothetical protein